MAQDNQAQLNAAIEAARRGDRATAQRLLQVVVQQDPDNELAWMWLASSSLSNADKRRYLDRVLEINPNNQTARTALSQLGGVPAVSAQSPTSGAGELAVGGIRNLVTIGIGLLLVVSIGVLIYVIVGAVRNLTQTGPNLTEVVAFNTELAATQNPPTPEASLTPSITPTFAGRIVTPGAAATLPPTFTPTPEPTATETPLPSETPLPLSNYTLYYESLRRGDTLPEIYRIVPGEAEEALDATGKSIAISPNGQQIAFLAPSTAEEADPAAVEIFVASATNPGNAQQLTNFNTPFIDNPTWSPDGEQILYVRDDVILESIALEDPDRVRTYLEDEDSGNKTDAVFSSEGTQIVFASDAETPNFLEIYRYTIDTRTTERLTDDVGNSFSPVVSPDGSQIAFISDRNGDSDLFVMNADGTTPVLVTVDDDNAEDRHPTWSPDGRLIAFSSNRNNEIFQIYLADLQQSEVIQITDNERNNLAPAFRP